MKTRLAVLAALVAATLHPAGASAAEAVICDGRAATITGTTGSDTLVGTEGPDVIAGLGGPDTISGLGGDDVLCGDEDGDFLYGGPGDDRLLGGFNATSADPGGTRTGPGDTVDPGPGDDYVDLGVDTRGYRGTAYDETLDYESLGHGITVDLVSGRVIADGVDTVVLVPGQTVHGTAYDDTMIGSARDDHFCGGPGDDALSGLDGDDVLRGDNVLGVGCDSQGGLDRADEGDDRLDGGTGDDELESRAGDDIVLGGVGRDVIVSDGAGEVVARGGTGRDVIGVQLLATTGVDAAGGRGHDILAANRGEGWRRTVSRARIEVDLGRGRLRAAAPGASAGGRVTGFEELGVAQLSRDRWVIRGTRRADYLDASNVSGGTVRILGLGGNDFLYGGNRSDRLDGGSGRDEIWGGAGRDRCVGAEKVRSC